MTTMTRDTFGPVPRADVYAAIDSERDYQDNFVIPTRDYYPTHTLGEFVLMINQYAAQAMAKWTNHKDSALGDEASLHELRKVAALAVRAMEQHGAPHRG